MQGINRRGHLVLAGLIGGLIGVLVVASWGLPAASPNVSLQSEPALGFGGREVQLGNASTSSPDLSTLQDTLRAHQRVEAEYYPGLNSSLSTGQSETGASGAGSPYLQSWQDALRAHQRVEADYYPGR